MAKSTKQTAVAAKKGDMIVVTAENGTGPKRKGARHTVASVITCHSRLYYRCKTEKGDVFHIAVASAKAVSK